MVHTAYGTVCPLLAQCILLSTTGILRRPSSRPNPGLCSLYSWKLPLRSYPHRSTHALTRFELPPFQRRLARVNEDRTPRRSYRHSANEVLHSRTQDSKGLADVQTAAEGVSAWKALSIPKAAAPLLRRWRFTGTGHAMGLFYTRSLYRDASTGHGHIKQSATRKGSRRRLGHQSIRGMLT